MLGTVINNPAKFCHVDGHVGFVLFIFHVVESVGGIFADLMLICHLFRLAQSSGIPSRLSALTVVERRIILAEGSSSYGC